MPDLFLLGVDPSPYGKAMGLAKVSACGRDIRFVEGWLVNDPSEVHYAIGPLDYTLVIEEPPAGFGEYNVAKSAGEVWRTIGFLEARLGKRAELISSLQWRREFGNAHEKHSTVLRTWAERTFGQHFPGRGKYKVHESIVNAALCAAGWYLRNNALYEGEGV
jgi:hypothetical protein